jgi:hypothetical protein
LSAQSTFHPENEGGVVELAALPALAGDAFDAVDFAVVGVERAAAVAGGWSVLEVAEVGLVPDELGVTAAGRCPPEFSDSSLWS